MTGDSGTQKSRIERPDLNAFGVTNASGDLKRVIVGKHFNHPQRIEIDPDDLMKDPDAYEGDSR